MTAKFTPMAAGLCPEFQLPTMAVPNFQDVISSAIAQGIAAGLQQRHGTVQPPAADPPASMAPSVQRALSLARSPRSQSPVSEDGEVKALTSQGMRSLSQKNHLFQDCSSRLTLRPC